MQLSDQLQDKFRLNESQKKALKKIGLFSVADLLFYFPTRYSDISEIKLISEINSGEKTTLYGKISKLKTKKSYRSKIPMAEGEIEDISGKLKIIWFHQAYLAKILKNNDTVKITGKILKNKNGFYLSNPEIEKTPNLAIDFHHNLFHQDKIKEIENFYPIYRETKGITSKWLYYTLNKIFKEKTLDNLNDYLPAEILKKYNLPSLKTALFWIHKPKNKKNSEAARKRFAFEEVFFIQLKRQHDKNEYQKNKAFIIKNDLEEIKKFINTFPFQITSSQAKAIEIILADLEKNYPMAHLLEGDVGSGKTAVAATAAYNTILQRPLNILKKQQQNFGHLQVAYMAPTEILANQHFESFIEYFKPLTKGLPISLGLITSSGCKKFPSKVNSNTWTSISRAQLLKWTANGEIPILIGTHSLIQKKVKFKNLALVIIDEQHRFGTEQRRKLVRKDGLAPHLLSMTATPIPRTLALTIYGDLDLTLLDEMPPGRKKIITEIITPDKREEIYNLIKKELKNGRQLYVICPRIFEEDEGRVEFSLEGLSQADEPRESTGRARPDSDPKKKDSIRLKLEMKAVTSEAKILKKEIFPEYEIGILHSKMSKQKKEEVMKKFSAGEINILVATSVVEVGVNVPNATMIIIEGAERFGLAQLHQLRGRVIRSNHQAYCYVFANAKTDKTIQRLKALKNAKNGFELAELDLSLRGSGELSGIKQWGISDLAMEAIRNIKMVEAARVEAKKLISQDPELKNFPILKQKVKEKTHQFHFE